MEIATATEEISKEDMLLMEKSISFFVKAYSKKTGKYIAKEELMTDAYLGLLSARKNFDPTKSQWTTYLPRRIKGALLDGIRRDLNNKGVDRQGCLPNGDKVTITSIENYINEDGSRYFDVSEEIGSVERYDDQEQMIADFCKYTEGYESAAVRAVAYLYMMCHHSMATIAPIVGMSESRVSQMINDIREYMASTYNGEVGKQHIGKSVANFKIEIKQDMEKAKKKAKAKAAAKWYAKKRKKNAKLKREKSME